MAETNRSLIMRIHLALAAIFLPFGLVFLVTGALFTLDVKGGSTERAYEVRLDNPLAPDQAFLTAVAREQLVAHGYGPPNTEPEVKWKDGSYYLKWSDPRHTFVLKPTSDPHFAKLKIEDLDWLSRLMRVHKAGAGPVFKALAVTWSVGLLLLFLTGFSLTLKLDKVRGLALASLGAGFALFMAVFLTS